MRIQRILIFSEQRVYINPRDIGPKNSFELLAYSLQQEKQNSHSGCRESNPGYMTPSHVYYHYTTARFRVMSAVGPPGIEPGLYEPESYVLPVYYGPVRDITRCTFQDSNLRPFECESNALTN